MALIPEFHVVAPSFPVSTATNPEIIQGDFVMLNGSGNAVKATGASGTFAVGVSADNTIEAGDGEFNTASQDGLVINSRGKKVKTTVRASDPSHDETAASGKLSVYLGGGVFHSDRFETENGGPITYTPGDDLYVSANGKLTNVASANSQVVGILTVAPREYPSGVPGTDTADGSISWGSYMTFILKI